MRRIALPDGPVLVAGQVVVAEGVGQRQTVHAQLVRDGLCSVRVGASQAEGE